MIRAKAIVDKLAIVEIGSSIGLIHNFCIKGSPEYRSHAYSGGPTYRDYKQ